MTLPDGPRLPAAYLMPGTSSFSDFLSDAAPDLLPSRRAVPQGHAGDTFEGREAHEAGEQGKRREAGEQGTRREAGDQGTRREAGDQARAIARGDRSVPDRSADARRSDRRR